MIVILDAGTAIMDAGNRNHLHNYLKRLALSLRGQLRNQKAKPGTPKLDAMTLTHEEDSKSN